MLGLRNGVDRRTWGVMNPKLTPSDEVGMKLLNSEVVSGNFRVFNFHAKHL